MLAPIIASDGGLHLAEFAPPLLAGAAYLTLYTRRGLTLAREGRPIDSWRIASFVAGVLLMAAAQLPPFDGIADEIFVVHMAQHLIIGDFAALLIVLGLTGPVLAPLLRIRVTRPLRVLAHPVVALVLWTVDIYAWHLPLLYQLAIEHDLVHALEHACMLWFGTLLWLGLLGPLPKPAWFNGWGRLGYVVAMRFAGAILANILIWAQTVIYPIYTATDAAHNLKAISDQNLAGGLMMVEEVIFTTLLLGWVFYGFVREDEDRQQLLDLAATRGVELSDERAARAAASGEPATERLRRRLIESSAPDGAAER